MFIKQISVFLENQPGTLRELTELMGKNHIDIRELSVADTQSFGIVRLILKNDDLDCAMEAMKKAGYMARINHVICAEVADEPGGLSKLLGVIENNRLSVEYLYSCRHMNDGNALMVLRLSDQERGRKVLEAAGVRVLNQEEADKL